MIAAELIGQVLAAGGRIATDGPDLVLTAPRPLPGDLLVKVKAHKPEVLAALAETPKHCPPVPLHEALARVCQGVEGITAAEFRSLLSPEDIADIEASDIPVLTLHAYARSFAEGIRSGRVVVLPRLP